MIKMFCNHFAQCINIFLDFFLISLYAIRIHWKCAKLKKTTAKKKKITKQKAFRECRHHLVCDLWPLRVTLTLSQGQKGLCHLMSRILSYLGTKCDVCECKTLRDMTISSFLWPLTFACDLHRPSRSLSFLS